MKKGELSINLIVVSAIALIILVVIVYLIFGVPRDINKSKECAVLNGECTGDSTCQGLSESNGAQYTINPQGRCGEGELCCIKVS